MKPNLKDWRACNDCDWKGPSGELLIDWDDRDEMLYRCPECQGTHLIYVKAPKTSKVLPLHHHNKFKSGHAS